MKRITATMLLLCATLATAATAHAAKDWVVLFNCKDKAGWHLRHDKDGWSVGDSVLKNVPPSTDLISDVPMGDCELHVEFMVPKDQNSGVYLQGRYEVQVLDSFEKPLDSHMCGAIYSKITPKENASKAPGEWQTFDITFHQAVLDADGKKTKNARVTVVQNGKTIIDDAEIDGCTGSAVDGNEGKPAGMMLQGDHGVVSFRNIKMRPL